MLKKKQVITMMSIAVMSFLIGTMFSTNFMALGSDEYGIPFAKIWEAIYDLQARVTSLEDSTSTNSKIKTIRFYEPAETMNDQQTYVDGAVFVWTPNNSTNNAILSINWYFQYRCEHFWGFRMVVNDEDTGGYGYHSSSVYTWSKIVVYPMHYLDYSIFPNQNSYTLKFQFESWSNEFPAYVKDINLVITVADGLTPSN